MNHFIFLSNLIWHLIFEQSGIPVTDQTSVSHNSFTVCIYNLWCVFFSLFFFFFFKSAQFSIADFAWNPHITHCYTCKSPMHYRESIENDIKSKAWMCCMFFIVKGFLCVCLHYLCSLSKLGECCHLEETAKLFGESFVSLSCWTISVWLDRRFHPG